jgi:Cu(I)/Ag(I) efflux system membrane fusion protein
MKRIRWILLAIVLAAGPLLLSACKGGNNHGGAAIQKTAKYHCPMHPTYVSDKPGDCPICGMKLVPMEPEAASTTEKKETPSSTERKPLFYRNPMHPEVTSPVPMKDEMGMDYVPVYEDETTPASAISDRATVKIPAQREQLIGVRTQPVEKRPLEFLVRAAGRVAHDPDLYNAISEYKEALRGRSGVKESPLPEVRGESDSLVRSAALRLRQMGISDAQIRDLSKGDQSSSNLLVGETNGKVWVYAQVFEYESGMIRPGQTMEVTSSALPGKRFQGKVVAVDTILNADSRTLKVRAEISTPADLLKHEMFVDAVIHVDLGTRLAIPEDALMDTGTRQLAFVKTGEGLYEPREIQIGHEAEGYYEVLSGLKEGEEVVTSANFLIDSESRLKAAIK